MSALLEVRELDVHYGVVQALDRVSLCVEDEGQGFDAASRRAHSSGLIGMRERAMSAGGRLRVESRPGAGTRLLVELPIATATVDGESA